MKKVTTLAASVAIISSSAMAGDWFVGIEVGKTQNNIEAAAEASTANGANHQKVRDKYHDKKAGSNSFGIRIGKYLNDNVRVYGAYTQGRFKDSGTKEFNNTVKSVGGSKYKVKDQNSLMFSADYVFMKDSVFRPFVGGSLGLATVAAFDKSSTGLAYGAQAGVLFAAGPVDLELGLKYRANSAKVQQTEIRGASLPGGGDMLGFEFKNKSSSQAYLSAAYRF
ncbi:MAG: outer membrane beta-barrel protein [Endozoicomonas sp.]